MNLHDFIAGRKWKKIKKDQWLIVFLAGILLLVIAVPTDCGSGQSGKSASVDKKERKENTENSSGAGYETAIEERLEKVLSQIEGAGEVHVMVTLKDGGEAVVEKDITTSGDTTGGTDSEGVRSEETKSERSEETVYSEGDGEGDPFISKQIAPAIEGVLVVAQGGGNTRVAENISEAVQALFSVEAHKIKVVKMDLQEGLK